MEACVELSSAVTNNRISFSPAYFDEDALTKPQSRQVRYKSYRAKDAEISKKKEVLTFTLGGLILDLVTYTNH